MGKLTTSDTRLVDFVLENEKKTSYLIEKQFPSIYRESGRELIDLVKSYYEFLENNELQSIYNIRKIYEYRNIDTTLEKMLFFFKTKFLNGLFFEEDIRFIVKHILDLYRRKGSKDGIELFFRLFFQSEVDVYYPSVDIIKPSQSKWKEGIYLQLYPVKSLSNFDNLINTKIYGNKSNAEAFVDNIVFINLKNSYIPIIFLSNIRGSFIRTESIYSLNPQKLLGILYGSLSKVLVDDNSIITANNNVGDLVELRSNGAVNAKGIISKISNEISGELNITLIDGGFGYTVENTDILFAHQNIFFANSESNDFNINEKISQLNSSNTIVSGTVISKNIESIGIVTNFTDLTEQSVYTQDLEIDDFNPSELVMQTNSYGIDVYGTVESGLNNLLVIQLDRSYALGETEKYYFQVGYDISTVNRVVNISSNIIGLDDDYFFSSGIEIQTTQRGTNISRIPVFTTQKNISGKASIDTISNTETVQIFTDLIENYLDVPLDANNYSEVPPALFEMSGTTATEIEPNLETPLNEAFVIFELTIGELNSIKDIDPGKNYRTSVGILPKEDIISRFKLKDQILEIIPPDFLLLEGDNIYQEREITNLAGDQEEIIVKGKIKRIRGNAITVQQKSFYSFSLDYPFYKEGNSDNPITIKARSRDIDSASMGLNAQLIGDTGFVGKIENVDIIDSGIGFEHNSYVEIFNLTKGSSTVPDASGIALCNTQGKTEGKWSSLESNIIGTKYIQDSNYYQDYSYELITPINPSIYEETYKNLFHVSGMKLFNSFGKKNTAKIASNFGFSFDFADFTPLDLFDVNSIGYWPDGYDPAFGRLFQMSDETSPTINPSEPIGFVGTLVGDKNVVQETLLSRPSLSRIPKGGRWNTVPVSEAFAGSGWTRNYITVTDGVDVGSGRLMSRLMTSAPFTVFTALRYSQKFSLGVIYEISIDAKVDPDSINSNKTIGFRIKDSYSSGGIGDVNVAVNIETGVITSNSGAWTGNVNVGPLDSDGVRRITIEFTPTSIETRQVIFTPGSFSTSTSGISVFIDRVSIAPAGEQYQRVITDRDITEAGIPDVWHVFNDDNDSLPLFLPTGNYTIAWVNMLGAVTITENVPVTTTLDTLRGQNQADVLIINRTLAAGEKTALTAYWNEKYGVGWISPLTLITDLSGLVIEDKENPGLYWAIPEEEQEL